MLKKGHVLKLSAVMILIICATVQAKIIYVDDDAAGINDGTSWSDAYMYLQDALMLATSGDEIRIAGGIYKPSDFVLSKRPNMGREETFLLKDNITIKGGYAGPADPHARNIELHKTVLSGDINDNDVELDVYGGPPVRTSRLDNSFNIITAADHDTSALLDGFIIQSGYGYGQDHSVNKHGTALNNSAGGNIKIKNCTFNENKGHLGGCIYSKNGNLQIIDCTFIKNIGEQGGAAYHLNDNAIYDRCKFYLNWGWDVGGAIYTRIKNEDFTSSIEFKNCIFTGNFAEDWGGGAIWHSSGSTHLINCTLAGNKANDGGDAIWKSSGSLTISNSIVTDEIRGSYGSPGSSYPVCSNYMYNDPLFISPPDDGGDGWWKGNNDNLGDLHLSRQSPCIDTGGNECIDSEYDLGGNPRITGNVVDIGAYESNYEPDIIYVDDDAAGANDGSSWENAYLYLQDALMMAPPGTEIRVAQGTYRPDDFVLSDRPSLGRGETFRLKNRVAIKGGYAGADNPDARDINKYETILSGDLQSNDIDFDSWDWEDVRSYLEDDSLKDNAYTVVTADGVNNSAMLDGFTIIAGIANIHDYYGPGSGSGQSFGDNIYRSPENNGGGMYISSACPAIRNCRFYRNGTLSFDNDTGGGAILCVNSSPILENCSFIENMAFSGDVMTRGGAMLNISSNLSIKNCTFKSNYVSGFDSEYYGGAVFNHESSLSYDNCSFIENRSEYSTAGALFSYKSDETFTNCDFTRNKAFYGCAAVACSGANDVVFDNCTFSENTSIYTSSISSSETRLKINNCLFRNNVSRSGPDSYGAVIENWFNDVQIKNTLFAKNITGWKGLIHNFNNNLELKNCTLADNSIGEYGDTIFTNHYCDLTLSNCIMRNNLTGDKYEVFAGEGLDLHIEYCDIQGGKSAVFVDGPDSDLIWGPGNIDADPLFADTDNCDYHLKSQAGRWNDDSDSWITDDVTSPCIDGGSPAMPIGYEVFPNGGIVNMGAYGGTNNASKSYFGDEPCEIIIAGDINGDCSVNMADFAIMATHWLESGDSSI